MRNKLILIFITIVLFVLAFLANHYMAPNRIEITQIDKIIDIAPVAPVLSASGNLVVFSRDNTIKIVSVEGQLSEWYLGEDLHSYTAWLDSLHVVFQKSVVPQDRIGHRFQLWVLNIRSGETFLLDDNVFVGNGSPMVLSPTRNRLAFEQQVFNEEQSEWQTKIFVLDIDNNTVIPILPPTSWACQRASWYLDNSRIIFYCSKRTQGTKNQFEYEVWLADIDKSEYEKMNGVPYTPLSFSPDGQWVIYQDNDGNLPPMFTLSVAPVEDGKPKFKDGFSLKITIPDFPPSIVTWSEDSKHFVFSGTVKVNGEFENGTWYVSLKE